MKKTIWVVLLSMACALVGGKYDDSELQDKVKDIDGRVTALENKVKELTEYQRKYAHNPAYRSRKWELDNAVKELKQIRWENNPDRQKAQEVAAKRLPLNEGHGRLKNPFKIIGQTEKAYKYQPTSSEENAKGFGWLPKSQVTAAEGHIIGMPRWLFERQSWT